MLIHIEGEDIGILTEMLRGALKDDEPKREGWTYGDVLNGIWLDIRAGTLRRYARQGWPDGRLSYSNLVRLSYNLLDTFKWYDLTYKTHKEDCRCPR